MPSLLVRKLRLVATSDCRPFIHRNFQISFGSRRWNVNTFVTSTYSRRTRSKNYHSPLVQYVRIPEFPLVCIIAEVGVSRYVRNAPSSSSSPVGAASCVQEQLAQVEWYSIKLSSRDDEQYQIVKNHVSWKIIPRKEGSIFRCRLCRCCVISQLLPKKCQ